MSNEAQCIRVSEADGQAIDALVEGRFDADLAPAHLRDRSQRIVDLLGLLEHLPEQRTGDLLMQRTLAAVEAARRRERRVEPPASLGLGLGVSLREVLAIAAMLLLGLSLLWPMLAQAQGTARQIACQQNLAGAGFGFQTYAAAQRGQMPAIRMELGDPWWLTGRLDERGNSQSNSAHLFLLGKLGYTPIERLACPENPQALAKVTEEELTSAFDWPTGQSVSFSYQNQYSADRPRMDRGPMIAVLADKNPFFQPGRYLFQLGQRHRDDAVSENHARRGGQNVLTTDGTVRWLVAPSLGGDNIFHVGERGLDNYTGLEGPRDEEDSFLVY